MYRAFVYFAFLAFCSGAPYGDVNSARSFIVRQNQQFIPQPMTVTDVQQHDETDLVDTLGAGYSFFKKQPIVSRPLAQQKLAISEQQVPITSLDDTSNQWSGYTQASAFKQQPIHTQVLSGSKDLLVGGGGNGQQTFVPRSNLQIMSGPSQVRTSVVGGYGNQQQDFSFMPTTLVSQDQGSYGSVLSQDQSQILQPIVQQQQPLIRNLGNSYGQQVQPLVQQQQPLVQQQQPLAQQLQQPLIRNLGNSYGQQVQPVVQDQQPIQVLQPLIRNLGNSYGQQVQPLVQEQQPIQILQPLIRNLGNSYGQQEVQTVVQDQEPFHGSHHNHHHQRLLESTQPLIRNLGNSYGQQDVQTVAQDQQPFQSVQPMIRNLGNSYGQQNIQPTWASQSNNAFGQQTVSIPTSKTILTQQQQQPDFSSSQVSQPSWSFQQTELPQTNGGGWSSSRLPSQSLPTQLPQTNGGGWSSSRLVSQPIPTELPQTNGGGWSSSRLVSQPQPTVQTSDSGSFGGW